MVLHSDQRRFHMANAAARPQRMSKLVGLESFQKKGAGPSLFTIWRRHEGKAELSTQLQRRLSNMCRHKKAKVGRTLDPTPERSLGRCLALSRTLGKVRCVNRRAMVTAVTTHRAPHRHTYPVSRSVLPRSLTARGSGGAGCGMRRCCLGAALHAQTTLSKSTTDTLS